MTKKYNGGKPERVLPHFTRQIPADPAAKLASPGCNYIAPPQ